MQTPSNVPVQPSATQAHKKHRLWFILAMLVVYLPVFICLAVTQARWYGWAVAALTAALLPLLRTRRFWRGWRAAACFVAAALVAVFGLYLARPAQDETLLSQIRNGAAAALAGSTVRQPEITLTVETDWTPPDGYELKVVPLANATMEILTRTDSESDYAVLQLHGGAFIAGMNDMYRNFALRYSQLFNDCLVASPDYRLAPEYPYPAQQEDTQDAWRYLTETLGYAADRVVVVGDSAGGNLALYLGLYLRDNGRAMPAGFVCMSPWADLSNSGASHTYNATDDPSFGIDESDFYGQAVGVDSTYADDLDATDPYVSPSLGDYDGFPPMLLQAGSIEVLLSDSEIVYDNAKQYGVDCTLTVYKGMFHVFQGTLDQLEQSKLAWQEVGTFLQKLIA